ncbi:glycosidase [Sphingobium sp. D43FB]|nr:glycosidase [Sphingobium sp. D43FB]
MVIRPFIPADDPPRAGCTDPTRAQCLANRVLNLEHSELAEELERVVASLSNRHRNIEDMLLRRYHEVNGQMIDPRAVSTAQAHLIGAYFCEEYSFEAAALFNPSIVAHPDQRNVAKGAVRFILSLRGVGEGHVSSITFRTGLCTGEGIVSIDPASLQAISPRIENMPGGAPGDPGVRLLCKESQSLSEIVIFPTTFRQRHGIEDLRMVRFVDEEGNPTYLGTYTAFSGEDIRSELLRTTDFQTFELTPLHGPAAVNKGMALFPRRIDGQYVMLGRLDHENIWLLKSNDLYTWDAGIKILSPRWVWEFVQLGNCGSPIEIDEGWLVLIHGVGPVRNYCIGACLLDKQDPTKVIGRLATPLLRPSPQERDGYVPNVVYSCGALLNGRSLILPYAIADSFTTVAVISIDALLEAMIHPKPTGGH